MNDFVRNDEVMHRIFGAALRPSVSFAQSGHARVTAGCLQYLHSAMQSQKRALLENLDQPWSWLEEQYRGLNKRRPNPLQRIWQEDEFPFWSYASRNWRKHLSSAEIDQVSHDNLMVVIQRDCILMDFLINHQRGIDVCTTGSCAKKQLRKRFCQPMRKAIKATLEKKGEDVRADTQVRAYCLKPGSRTSTYQCRAGARPLLAYLRRVRPRQCLPRAAAQRARVHRLAGVPIRQNTLLHGRRTRTRRARPGVSRRQGLAHRHQPTQLLRRSVLHAARGRHRTGQQGSRQSH